MSSIMEASSISYGCVGIEMSSHVLNLELELVLCTITGALNTLEEFSVRQRALVYLEGQMFHEMSRAICCVCFGSASSIDPHSHSRGLSPWRVLGRDLDKSDTLLSGGVNGCTVKPLDNVVDSVLEGVTGLAYLLRG